MAPAGKVVVRLTTDRRQTPEGLVHAVSRGYGQLPPGGRGLPLA